MNPYPSRRKAICVSFIRTGPGADGFAGMLFHRIESVDDSRELFAGRPGALPAFFFGAEDSEINLYPFGNHKPNYNEGKDEKNQCKM